MSKPFSVEDLQKYGEFKGCKYYRHNGRVIKMVLYTYDGVDYQVCDIVDEVKEDVEVYDIKFGGF